MLIIYDTKTINFAIILEINRTNQGTPFRIINYPRVITRNAANVLTIFILSARNLGTPLINEQLP